MTDETMETVQETVQDSAPDWTQQDGAERFGGDVNKLWKSYRELESYQGNSIRIPSEHASDEDRAKVTEKLIEHFPNLMYRPDIENPDANLDFWRTLGTPSEPTKYSLPEGVNADDAQEWAKMAHEARLTNSQFQTLTRKFHEQQQAQAEQSETSAHENAVKLKEMWGLAADENVQRAAKFADMTKAPDLLKQVMADPAVMSWVYEMSKNIGEGTEAAKQQNSPQYRTPLEASAMLDEIYGNKSHPLFNVRDPGHEAAKQLVVKLMAEANPGSSKDSDFKVFDSGSRRV